MGKFSFHFHLALADKRGVEVKGDYLERAWWLNRSATEKGMDRLRLEWQLFAHPLSPAPADDQQASSVNGERTGAPQNYGTRWGGNLS